MHLNPCNSLQECGNRTVDNFLTAHIIVSSFGGQASAQMQPTEPTYIAAIWGVVLEAALRSLECTTHRGLSTVFHPSLIRRFQTNDRKLRYRRLRHVFFCYTLLSGTKSKRGNKYAELYVTKSV